MSPPNELLPGADPEQDCLPPPVIDEPEDTEDDHAVTWASAPSHARPDHAPLFGWLTGQNIFLRGLERLALLPERLANALTGAQQLNPFYHTGTIAVFLLLVVAFTGLYLTLFFQFGFEGTYVSVAKMESQLVARIIRAIHRYASGAAVIVTLLHGLRTFFMGRFRGPRWLAWVSGVAMVAVLWGAGVTGYWLVWDERAQWITAGFVQWLGQRTPLATSFALWLLSVAQSNQGWLFILAIFLAHLLLSAIIGLFFWLHIKRLNRPKFLPRQYWLIIVGVALILVSAAMPVGMLPRADLSRLPGSVGLDPIFLFYLPLVSSPWAGWLWAGLAVAGVALSVAPWLKFRPSPPRVNIDKERCTGCTKCAVDCPYSAIAMIPRTDGAHKFIALENPALCVSCGVCLGSCDGLAVSLGDLPAEMLWQMVETRLALVQTRSKSVKVIFTCERHAAHGARPYLNAARESDGQTVVVLPLPCAASAHPSLLTRTLDAGAAEVLVAGCPPDDCAQREGNLWEEERLSRKRLPRLKRGYENAPISALWLPPDEFSRALTGAHNHLYPELRWRNFLPAFALAGLALLAQALLNNLVFQPYPANVAVAQIALANPAEAFGATANRTADEMAGLPTRLILEVDGRAIYQKTYTPAALFSPRPAPLFEELQLAPGEHHLRLSFSEAGKNVTLVLFDQSVTLEAGQVLSLTCCEEAGPPGGSPRGPR